MDRPTWWFRSRGRPQNFEQAFLPLRGKPVNYLEIGVFCGESIKWVAENVLTHPQSKGYGIDPWLPMLPRWTAEICQENYELAQEAVKHHPGITLVRAPSSVWLRTCGIPGHYFDAIYIDGDHGPPQCLDDFVLCWPLLKIGGALIFDDYVGKKSCIPLVIELVKKIYGTWYEELFCNSQYGLRKTGDFVMNAGLPDGSDRPPGLLIS